MVYSNYCHQGSLQWHKSGTQRCNQNTCFVDGIFLKSIIRSGERKPIYQTLKPKPPPTHITLAIASSLNRLDILNLNLHVHLCRLIYFCHEFFYYKEYCVFWFLTLISCFLVLQSFCTLASLWAFCTFAILQSLCTFAGLQARCTSIVRHLPFSNRFVSLHIFLFFNLFCTWAALQALCTCVTIVSSLFVLNKWVFSLLVHLRDSPPLSLFIHKNRQKNSYTCQLNSRQNSNQTIRF